MEYRFSLDRTAKKFLCPNCHKKRFVKYIVLEADRYLRDYVGRCDRETNCGYHYTPKQLFQDEPQLKQEYDKTTFNGRLFKPIEVAVTPDFITPALVNQSMKKYEDNSFINFLRRLFGTTVAQQLASKFRLGTSKKWQSRSVIFWQIDTNLQARSGKIMLYNEKTGKRMKINDRACIDWVHSILIRNNQLVNFQLSQCLFGLHQINTAPKDKVIAIVESEKTAILMTAIIPQFIWLACGSASNLKLELFHELIDRQLMLFPDLGCYKKWQEKAYELQQINPTIWVSDLLKNKATAEDKANGLDLADFLIKTDSQTGLALSNNHYPLY